MSVISNSDGEEEGLVVSHAEPQNVWVLDFNCVQGRATCEIPQAGLDDAASAHSSLYYWVTART